MTEEREEYEKAGYFQEYLDGEPNYFFYRESDMSRFGNLITKYGAVKAVFSHVAQGFHQHLNAKGKMETRVHVREADLYERRKRLLKQSIFPDETDKAIAAVESRDPTGP